MWLFDAKMAQAQNLSSGGSLQTPLFRHHNLLEPTSTMETPDLHPLIEDLTSNIDDLSDSLTPLLAGPLSHQTSKLPLLDQAKLYVLATYAIESLLFSSLRLSGVDAKAHPVFQELSRVKEYFNKIKAAESGGAGAKKGGRIDKEAAGRFIRAGLAGNERYDRERAERGERERAGAKRKLEGLGEGVHTRFDGIAEIRRGTEDEGSGEQEAKAVSGEQPKQKKRKGHKAPKAANRFGPQYAELATRDAAEEAAKGGDQVPDHANGDDEDADSMTAQAPQKARSRSSRPKNTKEALESLLGDVSEDKSGKRKRKRKKSTKQSEGEQAEDVQ